MALSAIDPLMCAGKIVPCEAVIEGFFFKSDHFKFPAVVFTVAIGTFFFPDFSGIVVPIFSSNAALYFFMAGQAFVIRYFFPQYMTLGTIRNAFQLCMRSG